MKRPHLKLRTRRQTGIAFIVVLWLLALLAILLGAFALLARTENLQAHYLFDSTRALYAAEAGVNRAVYELLQPDPQQRWIPDGRNYSMDFEEAKIEIQITDESGKIDINAADAQTLELFFQGTGMEQQAAAAFAAAIIDWRDPDDLVSPNGAEDGDYESAGLPYGAKDASFDTVSEVQQVLGMTYDLFRQIEPGLTVFTGQGRPNAAFAPLEALRSFPGLDNEMAQGLLQQRQAWDPATGGAPPLLPDGTPLMVQGGTGTYSIQSRATLPNGAWTRVKTTIRVGGGTASGLAYTVLRWEDGEPL